MLLGAATHQSFCHNMVVLKCATRGCVLKESSFPIPPPIQSWTDFQPNTQQRRWEISFYSTGGIAQNWSVQKMVLERQKDGGQAEMWFAQVPMANVLTNSPEEEKDRPKEVRRLVISKLRTCLMGTVTTDFCTIFKNKSISGNVTGGRNSTSITPRLEGVEEK